MPSIVTNQEINIKALLVGTLTTLTLAITPAWGGSETPTAKPTTVSQHKVTKAHKAGRKHVAVSTATLAPQAVSTQTTVIADSAVPPTPHVAMPVVIAATAAASPAAVLAPRPYSPPANPYLQTALYHPVAAEKPQGVFFPAIGTTPTGDLIPAVLSYLPNGIGKLPEVPTFSDISARLKNLVPADLLALLPVNDGESHWPIDWKTVYPTGERPLWVLTLKCPTEAAFGVAPPPVKIVHVVLTAVMDGINSTKLLPVDLQQVCR